MQQRPNIILIVADQFRYDAIHAHGNDWISTPTFDQFVQQGCDFTQAYSATPTCVPARASLLSGLSQDQTGLVGYEEGANWAFPQLLGGAFAQRGYYAKAIGKMHVSPPRKLCGFHHIELHDGYLHGTRHTDLAYGQSFAMTDDYLTWLREQVGSRADLPDIGLDCNSWVARPFHLEERYHPTNWATERAIDFLYKRDTSLPFFLKLSYVRPHSPLDPPEYYFNMYRHYFDTLSEATFFEHFNHGEQTEIVQAIDAYEGTLSVIDYKNMLAGYYGLITHLDHQINRLLIHLKEQGLWDNTVILFTSDHGDQLGQHHLFRKGYAYQDSIHIPLMIFDPGENICSKNDRNASVDDIIELRDILPTLVDIATEERLENVSGKSFKPLMIKDKQKQTQTKWREYLHGEHVLGEKSNQYLLELPWKYIWFTQTGEEAFYNVMDDATEQHNLINQPEYKHHIERLRERLIQELIDRPEGFVKEGQLIAGREQSPLLPINQTYKY